MVASPMDRKGRPVTTISAIITSVMIMGVGSALLTTVLSVRAGLEGIPESVIGLVLSGYYIGLVAGTFVATLVIPSVGYVRAFAAFASLASAVGFMHILIINPVVWFFFRVLYGICLSVMQVVSESWLNVTVTNTHRGRVLSLYSIALLASLGMGQPLIGQFSPGSFEIFGITTIIVSLCLLPITLAQVSGTPKIKQSKPMIKQTFLRSPLAGVGVTLSGLLYGGTWSLLPRYGQQIGFTNGEIGLSMLLLALGTLFFQWPLGWLSDKRGRRSAIFLSSSGALFISIIIISADIKGPLLFLLFFLFGGGGMPLYSLAVALMNDRLKTEEMVQAAGTLILFYGVGAASGPIISGMVMSKVGPQGLFYTMALPVFLFLLFTVLRLIKVPRLKRPARLEPSHYHPYPRTTAAVFSLLKKTRRNTRDPGPQREKG